MLRKHKIQPLFHGPEGDPPAGTPPAQKPEAKFTQADLDEHMKKRLGEERKKFDQAQAATLEKMAKLETDAAAKAELEKQLEELNNRYKSKEELAADALKKERADYTEKLKKSEAERDSWRKRFEDQSLLTQITSAVTKKTKDKDGKDVELSNPNQFVSFIKPMTRLVEKVIEGKPTGELEARIKIAVKGKELDGLTPEEAIKAASEDPEYAHWFKSGAVGGLGTVGGKQGTGKDGLLSMPQEEFTKRFLEGTLPKRK